MEVIPSHGRIQSDVSSPLGWNFALLGFLALEKLGGGVEDGDSFREVDSVLRAPRRAVFAGVDRAARDSILEISSSLTKAESVCSRCLQLLPVVEIKTRRLVAAGRKARFQQNGFGLNC